MDGLTLTNMLGQLLEENSSSTWLDSKTTYDYLYEAACEFVRETECLTNTATITPVASTSLYDLPVDYMFLYLVDDQNQLFIKYNDGTNDYFIRFREYTSVVYGDVTSPQAVPDSFSVIDKRTVATNITGTATSGGTATGGECTLTDSNATFLSSVSVGDIVHNTKDLSNGVVLAVTSNTQLQTALFGGSGCLCYWTNADTYVIVPQGRKQLFFSPPFLNSGGTITIEYVQRPTPVYSWYRSYRFNPSHIPSIVKYATWLYKYRDREPSFADALFKHWDMQIKHMKASEGKGTQRRSWKINFNKRSWGDRSFR
jgi:hypothetical protein